LGSNIEFGEMLGRMLCLPAIGPLLESSLRSNGKKKHAIAIGSQATNDKQKQS